MIIDKVRFIEPGNRPYKDTILNYFVYDRYIRTPSIGLLTLATIVKEIVPDTKMYSESISKIKYSDITDADIVFIGAFTFNVNRAYEICKYLKSITNATIVLGGLHPTMCPEEALEYADYVLLGEGDNTIKLLIDCLKKDKPVQFTGVAYKKYVYGEGIKIINTGKAEPPQNINVIPDRDLLYNYSKQVKYNTIWGQVHASRGCPYSCDYCALVHCFGNEMRFRTPENIVEDIKRTIKFHDEHTHRPVKMLWITDDNFFANKEWAIQVLQAIIDSDIDYHFTIQARWEVGLDNNILRLLKGAGFTEIAMGIEFLEDESFKKYNKKSSYQQILESVENIQRHGIRVRGLFILGADNHTRGVGERLADFVIKHNISGVLIQSMYFIPGIPVYKTHKNKLLHKDWSKYNGNVVHYPEQMTPVELQEEIITASKKIYSFKRLIEAILHKKGEERLLFIGEYFWQMSIRSDLRKEIKHIKEIAHKKD